jgi:hypothetical protein
MNSRQTDIFKYFNERNSKITYIKNFEIVQNKFDKFILTLKTNKKSKCYLQ